MAGGPFFAPVYEPGLFTRGGDSADHGISFIWLAQRQGQVVTWVETALRGRSIAPANRESFGRRSAPSRLAHASHRVNHGRPADGDRVIAVSEPPVNAAGDRSGKMQYCAVVPGCSNRVRFSAVDPPSRRRLCYLGSRSRFRGEAFLSAEAGGPTPSGDHVLHLILAQPDERRHCRKGGVAFPSVVDDRERWRSCSPIIAVCTHQREMLQANGTQ